MKNSFCFFFIVVCTYFSQAQQQSTSKVLMVKPAHFGYNAQTATSNAFQHNLSLSPDSIQAFALREFSQVVSVLQSKGIDVVVLEDSPLPVKPDAIFPNNWVSFHSDNRVFIYPMASPNRRPEKNRKYVESLYKTYSIREIVDWSAYELTDQFLEGTGSMVLDRINSVVYACSSERTNGDLLNKFAEKMEYKLFLFHAFDDKKKPIYHTNVLLSLGTEFAVFCADAIPDKIEKESVLTSLTEAPKEVIEITKDQMKHFAANIIELRSLTGKLLIVLSETAYQSFTPAQRSKLSKFGELVVVSIPTIEQVGGGSIRCMIAEMFLKK